MATNARETAEAADTGAAPAEPPATDAATDAATDDPEPEQQPWLTPEDSRGWQRVYRGTGQKREVRNSLLLDLTPEQWTWLTRTAQKRGVIMHNVLGSLIEQARLADEAHGDTTKH